MLGFPVQFSLKTGFFPLHYWPLSLWLERKLWCHLCRIGNSSCTCSGIPE